jgi:protein involved in polysaccharide export with SLBB domain
MLRRDISRRLSGVVVATVSGLLVLLVGCVQPKAKVDWDAFMRTLAEEAKTPPDMTGMPDEPVSGLPPAPVDPEKAASTTAGLMTIQPDSVVQVHVNEDPGLDGAYEVNELSAIELSYVGPVFLSDMTEDAAATKIKSVLEKRYFNKATVSVRIIRASYDKVAVSGMVSAPGIVKIGSGDRISLNDALLHSGRITASLKGARIRIMRSGMTRVLAPNEEGEIYKFTDEEGQPYMPEVWLWNNDLAVVYNERGPRDEAVVEDGTRDILVLGEVREQGVYRFQGAEPCTLMHLVFKIGGLPDFANKKDIRVMRQFDDGTEEEFQVDITELMATGDPDLDFALENGDRIVIPARRASLFR